MKRIKIGIIALLLMLSCILPGNVSKAAVLSLGRVSVAMPQVSVEMRGKGYSAKDVKAKLGTEKLSVENIHEFSAEDSVCTYILIDLSGSVRGSFDLIKENINSYIDKMGDNDKVIIITFGETKVTSLLKGTESKSEIKAKVNKLQCTENGTLFYEALKEAYQMANATVSQYDREYVLAFSDGIDEQRGSTTYEEIKDLYKTHTLPLYAACASNASQNAADRFGSLARSSGGSIKMISGKNDFANLLKEINDVTLLELKADNNIADGQTKQLVIQYAGSQVECDVPVTRALEDKQAPHIKEIRHIAESNVFVIEFTESVLGADRIGAYHIVDTNGKQIGIETVKVSDSGKQVEVKVKNELRNKEYEISFKGITDCSNEKNLLTDKETIKVTGVKTSNVDLVWILLACLAVGVVIILVVVLLVMKSSKNSNDFEELNQGLKPVENRVREYQSGPVINEKHHIKAENITRVRLRIKTGRTSEQNIETNLVSSLIVGRSDTCDIYIDDTKLSRQHFVIESDGNNLYIMDLQSRNGTSLNGIRVNSRQILHSGDKIVAGLSDIHIMILE